MDLTRFLDLVRWKLVYSEGLKTKVIIHRIFWFEHIHKRLFISHIYGDLFLFVINFCLSSRNAKNTALKEVAADKIAVFDLLMQV